MMHQVKAIKDLLFLTICLIKSQVSRKEMWYFQNEHKHYGLYSRGVFDFKKCLKLKAFLCFQQGISYLDIRDVTKLEEGFLLLAH